MLEAIRTWYADDDDERAEVRADDLRDINAEVAMLRAEVEQLQALWDAVEKVDNWRDSHLLDEIYISTGSKWHADGDSALLGKGNGALELLWRGLWEPRHEDDVTVEVPTMREVIIALAAKLEEEA